MLLTLVKGVGMGGGGAQAPVVVPMLPLTGAGQ